MTHTDDDRMLEPAPELEREQPNDLDAEQALIGNMMLTEGAIDAADQTLRGVDDYYRPAHQLIHSAILEIHGRPGDERPSPITVAAVLRNRGDLVRIGGPAYLHRCVHAAATGGSAEWCAGIVRDMAHRRNLIESLTRALAAAWDPSCAPDEVIDHVTADMQELITASAAADAPKLSVADRWPGFLDELQAGKDPNALTTPWPDLNAVLEIKPGEFGVVGAATSGGKSTLALNLATWVALHHDKPVLVASMEMGGSELLARITAAEASVNLDRLVRRKPMEMDWERIARISERLERARNFVLDDTGALTVSKIRSRIRWMAANGQPPAMVIADYLQLITPEGSGSSTNRTQEVAKISRSLKMLATEFHIPVIALAQFNRGQVGREPQVTDFKDSSQIEQDANFILLMSPPLEELEPGATLSGRINVVVGKNRNGPRGREINLLMEGHYARLVSLTKQTEPGR